LDLNTRLPDDRYGPESNPGYVYTCIDGIVVELASTNLQAALDFLQSPLISGMLWHREADSLRVRAIAAYARINPRDAAMAVPHVETELERAWASGYVAEGMAAVDLDEAMSLWRGLELNPQNRQEILVQLLRNVPRENWVQARRLLEAELRPE